MLISSTTLRIALLRIFNNAGADADDGLAFYDIATAWTSTGLRNSDLRDAVNEMVECGDLRTGEREGALCFSLTAEARRRLLDPAGGLLLRATVEDEAALLYVRQRVPAAPADPGLRRRAADQR
jgi:hypothetical protein